MHKYCDEIHFRVDGFRLSAQKYAILIHEICCIHSNNSLRESQHFILKLTVRYIYLFENRVLSILPISIIMPYILSVYTQNTYVCVLIVMPCAQVIVIVSYVC
jgi:hypothetical protein